MTYAVVGHAGEIAVGEEGSPGGSHRPSGVASCRHRAVYEQKKVPVLPPHPPISRVQLPGSGAILLYYSLFSRKGAFRSQQQGFSSVRGQDTGSASRLTPLPGFSRRFAGRVLLTDLSFSGESRSPARRSSRVRWHGTSLRGPATNKTRPPPARITWAGITGSGASAGGSGPRRRRPVRVRGNLNSRFRENTDGHTRASDLTIDLPHRLAGRARAPSGYTRIPLRQHHGSHHGRPCRQFTHARLTHRPRRGVSAPGGALTPSLRLTERTGP